MQWRRNTLLTCQKKLWDKNRPKNQNIANIAYLIQLQIQNGNKRSRTKDKSKFHHTNNINRQ